MHDMTVIYYTANRTKPALMGAVVEQLKISAGDSPIVSVSQKPMGLGINTCVGNIGQSVWNIYHQMLVGARVAKTRYVAMAEDDILYPYEHFHTQYPANGEFLYDTNRRLIFTWKTPMFSTKGRIITGMLLCEREGLIEALEERFDKYPTPESIDIKVFGEVGRNEKEMGLKVRKVGRFGATVPSIMVNHEDSISYFYMGKNKASGVSPVGHIEGWGTAVELMHIIQGNCNGGENT